MSLFFDIGSGAGLAGASGVRPFLPPLLAGALARGDMGIDFAHTPYSFLQSPGFLAAIFALAALAYAWDRRRGSAPQRAGAGRDARELAVMLLGLVLGALLFAGAVAQAHHASWWGLIAGVACAALGYAAVARLLIRARRRVEGPAAELVVVYADLISLVLAGLAIAFAPLGVAALVVFAVLIARGRSGAGGKYEGLRILR